MNKQAKKILKIAAWVIGVPVALVVLAVLTLPLWLGPVVKPTVNTLVPRYTQTEFNLGHLYLNPYTGRFEMGDLYLGNPKGYDEPCAVAMSNLVVDVALTTLASEYVHIEEITVDQLFVSCVNGGEHGVNNFQQIQYNIAGSREQHEAAQAKALAAEEKRLAELEAAEAKADEAEKAKLEAMEAEERAKYESDKAEAELEAEAEAEMDAAAKKKFVIDRLVIGGITIKYGFLTLPLPSVTLNDIGKESGGATMAELVDQVWQSILKSANSVGDAANQAMDAVSAGASKSMDAVSESASKAADAVSAGAGKAADAVSESAGKAVDAIKNLW